VAQPVFVPILLLIRARNADGGMSLVVESSEVRMEASKGMSVTNYCGGVTVLAAFCSSTGPGMTVITKPIGASTCGMRENLIDMPYRAGELLQQQ
jgi:hypothetical protein